MTEPAFDVDAFAWTAPDRLELSGRWIGVRGVRFMRPTLVLVAGEEHWRLLALLEGKPWPAEPGRPWRVAFPWEGERVAVEAAELGVAPGISVVLPPPEGATGMAGAGSQAGVRSAGGRGILQRAADAERAQRELAAERAVREGLERERDLLRRERDVLRRERDALLRARDEAVLARDAAVRERDAALVVRDRLERERSGLVDARDRLRRERDEALRRGG